MQKKLIALAVAGLASAGAFAQSNVTAYGVADVYLGSFKTDGMERSTKVNSGGLAASRIGFKGVEDLGNGLKAVFVLEYGLSLDSNSGIGDATVGATQARQQMVALAGGFGTAAAGRLQTTAYDWAVKYDVLAGSALSALQATNANFLIGGTAVAARGNNAVAYISPNFAGVTVALNRSYIAEESGASGKANQATADLASISYDNGPLSLGAVYAVAKGENANGIFAGHDVKDWSVGGSYGFSFAKLAATYQNSKVDVSKSNKAWSLGAAVPVSAAGAVVASYSKGTYDGANPGTIISKGGVAGAGALAVAPDMSAWTLAYTHALSKRTTAYGGYTNQNPKGANNSTDIFVAGINHKF